MFFSLCITIQADEKTFTVVIDPGHGGKDPGAKGSFVSEKVINLAVGLKLGELITSNFSDVEVLYTRKSDKFIELSERANVANRNKADLFISIHTNAVRKASTVKGTETYTLGLAKTEENLEVAMQENSVILLEDNYLQRYDGFDPGSTESYIIFEFMQNKHMEKSIAFASEIQKEFASGNRVNRGVRQAGFLVLKATSMPSVLVELGFISNRDEEKFMRSKQGQNQLAKSIYNAFVKYKKDFDNSSSVSIDKNETVLRTNDKDNSKQNNEANNDSRVNDPDLIIYKIQIMSSDKKIPLSSSVFKGYKVQFYSENGLYKYTYGESTDKDELLKIHKKLTKDFKDSFIIKMKGGKRLK